jgi:hypothetical protein
MKVANPHRSVALRFALSAAVVSCVVCGFLTTPARAASYSDTYGAVTATLTDQDSTGAGLTLDINRNGVDFVDQDFAAACAFNVGCQPLPAYGAQVVSVRRAGSSSEPDVLVHLSNGGNICCRSTVIYHYDITAGAYERRVHVWSDAADSGPARSLGHPQQVYFVSDDGRFRYAFGCGACTPGPIQIWQDQTGTLVDVTRSFRGPVKKDAKLWLRLYLKQRSAQYGADGLLVAYVADEELLGQGRQVWKFVHREAQAGFVTGPGKGFSSPAAFYSTLHRFLRRLGYPAH